MSERPLPPVDRAAAAAAQWRRERPDLDAFPMELLGRLGELAGVITTQWTGPLFARFGLHRGEFDVLATLRRAGDPYALTPKQLIEQTMITSGGMTSRIDRLVVAALVERRPDIRDRRGTLVALTTNGLMRIDAMMAAHVANEQRVLLPLSAAEQHQLNGLLTKWLAGLHLLDPED